MRFSGKSKSLYWGVLISVLILVTFIFIETDAESDMSFFHSIFGPKTEKKQTIDSSSVDDSLKKSSWFRQVIDKLEENQYYFNQKPNSNTWIAVNRHNDLQFQYSGSCFIATPAQTKFPLPQQNHPAANLDYQETPNWSISLEVKGLSKSLTSEPLESRSVFKSNQNHAWVDFKNLVISYTNQPEGMRQDFIVKEKPSGNQKLKLHLGIQTNLRIYVNSNGVELEHQSAGVVMQYNHLKVWDAKGKILKSSFIKEKGGVAIEVDDAEAIYPITIDPLSSSPNSILNNGYQRTARFGYAASTAGGVNGDGYSDLIFGVPLVDNSGTDKGSAYSYNDSNGLNRCNNIRLYNMDMVTPFTYANIVETNLFGLGLFQKTPLQRDGAKLTWETMRNGLPFSGSPITNSVSFTDRQPLFNDLTSTGTELKSQTANAQTTYNTVAAGNWNNTAIWAGGLIPVAEVSANIININHSVNLNINISDAKAKMNVAAGTSFTINTGITFERYSDEPFKISGSLIVNGHMIHSSNDSISGIITLPGSEVIINNGGHLENQGNLNMLGKLTIQAGGLYENQGASQVGGEFVNNGTMENAGPLFLENTSVCNSGSYLLNGGVIRVSAGKTFTNNTRIDTLGSMTIYGTFENNQNANGGYLDVYNRFNNNDTLTGDEVNIYDGGVFENRATALYSSGSLKIWGLTANSGKIESITAEVLSGGIINNQSTAFFDNSLTLAGTFNNTGVARFSVFTISSGGVYNNQSNAATTMDGGGPFAVTGTFNNDGTANGRVQINATGLFDNKSTATHDFLNQASVINGTYTANAGGTMQNLGNVDGVGVFNGTFITGTIINPGTAGAPGVFTVNGNATIASGKILRTNINSTTVGTGYDRLIVNGTATLGGILQHVISFTPSVNTQFTILKSSSLSGTFASVSPALPSGWTLVYNTPVTGDVTLVYNAPTSVNEFASGEYIRIGPNPVVQDHLYVQWKLSGVNRLYGNIYNTHGQLSASFENMKQTDQLSLSHLPKGVYRIVIQVSSAKKYVLSFVKQ